MLQLSYSQYVPQYVGAPLDEIFKVLQVKQQKYETNKMQDLMMGQLLDNMSTSALDGDKAYLEYHASRIKSDMEQRAYMGDYENMDFEVTLAATRFASVAENVQKQRAAITEYQDMLEEGYQAGTYDFTTKQKAYELSMRTNKGLQFDPETGKVTGGYFNGYRPAKYVDITTELDNLFKDWQAEGKIGLPTSDGKIWISSYSEYVDEQELYNIGIQHLMNNKETLAYLQQDAMFNTMDMDDTQLQAYIDDNKLGASSMGLTAEEYNKLSPEQVVQQHMIYNQAHSASRNMALKHGFVRTTIDWQQDEYYKQMAKNQADMASAIQFSMPGQITQSLPTLDDFAKQQETLDNVAANAQIAFEKLINESGVELLHNADGTLVIDGQTAMPMLANGDPLQNRTIATSWYNLQHAQETAATNRAALNQFYQNNGIDASQDVVSILQNKYGDQWTQNLASTLRNMSYGSWNDILAKTYARLNNVDESNLQWMMDWVSMDEAAEAISQNQDIRVTFGKEASVLGDAINVNDPFMNPAASVVLQGVDYLLSKANRFNPYHASNLPAAEIMKTIEQDLALKNTVLASMPGMDEAVATYNEGRREFASTINLRSFGDNTVRTELEKTFAPMIWDQNGNRMLRVWDYNTGQEIEDKSLAAGEYRLSNWFHNIQTGDNELIWSVITKDEDNNEQVEQRIRTQAPEGFDQWLYSNGIINHQQTAIVGQVSQIVNKPTRRGLIGYDTYNGKPLPGGTIPLTSLSPNEQEYYMQRNVLGAGGQRPIYRTVFPYVDRETNTPRQHEELFYSTDEVVQYYLDVYLPTLVNSR